MAGRVIVTIGLDGSRSKVSGIEVQTKGFVGKACLAVTEEIRAANETGFSPTAEMHITGPAQTQIRLGGS